ncbi:MAG: hypothetical protein Q8O63_06695 [Hoeflea sp.]|nr:hypothetical protein [Hoeflea sp.]
MSDSTVIKMSRRKLLVGVAACVLGSGFEPILNGFSSEIIIQNGWLLKKSDLN